MNGNPILNQKNDNLEGHSEEKTVITYDSQCVRKHSNWSKSAKEFKLDDVSFNPSKMIEIIPDYSPKLDALLRKIDELDKADKKKHGKLFKHFIFSDLKFGVYGANMLASAMIAKGYNLGYGADLKSGKKKLKPDVPQEPSPKSKKSVETESDTEKSENSTNKSSIRSPVTAITAPSARAPVSAITVPPSARAPVSAITVPPSARAPVSAITVPPSARAPVSAITVPPSARAPVSAITVPPSAREQRGGEPQPKKKRYHKIELLSDDVLKKNKYNNFYLLTSVSIYDQALTVSAKKTMLSKFNSRPDNIHGELARFIILDSGFKEGIDLFDVKYVHIFEPSTVSSDQKQVIGRATRTCGQKGLEFHPTQGWPLYVFIYDLAIQESLRESFLGADTVMDLYFKSMNIDIRLLNFAHDLERTTVLGSVDYELNKNVHSFSIPLVSTKKENNHTVIDEHVKDNEEILYGGDKKQNLIVLPGKAMVYNTDSNGKAIIPERLGFNDMRNFIRENYGEFAWPKVKMENLCAEKKKGGAGGEIISYTPTQEFIRHYFHPMNAVKGMLLYHSVGTGKTCSAIAAATNNFEKQGYTILWVTRTTLKNDIWKNMFDQVCNETLRHEIEHSKLKIPDDQQDRMRMLSKSWRIRPMSYKQFSNLVSKQNSFYDTLIQINGKEDPLRRTLLIIDEAHKLYGGDDLVGVEKPDMNALHKALMHSYKFSGPDSVRVLLMTATPITKDPLEIIKLVNLCKPSDEQMPTEFSNFSEKYLNGKGEFTENGRNTYLNDIAGYISYLNREKDARQFAQPHIEHVLTPIISDIDIVKRFDSKLLKNESITHLSELNEKLEEENKKIENDLDGVTVKNFEFLKDEYCGEIQDKKNKTQCNKIVSGNIRMLVAEAKKEVQEIRKNIKNIKDQIKNHSGLKKTALKTIRANIEKYGDQYEKYKNSLLFELRDKCATRVIIKTNIDNHPEIKQYIEKIEGYNREIFNLQNQLTVNKENYKKRMDYLKDVLKTDLSAVERNVIKTVIREERKEHNQTLKSKMKDITESEKVIKEKLAHTEKEKKQKIILIKKTLKRGTLAEKKDSRSAVSESKKLRKTIKLKRDDIKHNKLKFLVNKYENQIVNDLKKKTDLSNVKISSKTEQMLKKQQAKQLMDMEKLNIRMRKEELKKSIRETKKREKEELQEKKKNARSTLKKK